MHDEVDCTDLEMAVYVVILFLWISLRTAYGFMTIGLQPFLAWHQQACLDIVCWCEQFTINLHLVGAGLLWPYKGTVMSWDIFQWNLKSSEFFSNQSWKACVPLFWFRNPLFWGKSELYFSSEYTCEKCVCYIVLLCGKWNHISETDPMCILPLK